MEHLGYTQIYAAKTNQDDPKDCFLKIPWNIHPLIMLWKPMDCHILLELRQHLIPPIDMSRNQQWESPTHEFRSCVAFSFSHQGFFALAAPKPTVIGNI